MLHCHLLCQLGLVVLLLRLRLLLLLDTELHLLLHEVSRQLYASGARMRARVICLEMSHLLSRDVLHSALRHHAVLHVHLPLPHEVLLVDNHLRSH